MAEGKFTLDDAVDSLLDLVDVARAQHNVLQGMLGLMTQGVGAGRVESADPGAAKPPIPVPAPGGAAPPTVPAELRDLIQNALPANIARAMGMTPGVKEAELGPTSERRIGRGGQQAPQGFLTRVHAAFRARRLGLQENFKDIGRWFKAGRTKTANAVRLAGFSRGAAGAAGVAGGAVAGLAAAAILTVKAFVDARDAVASWTEEAMETARRLGQVSGSMSAVVARRELEQMQRDVKRGEATAGTASTLMAAESRRKEQEDRLAIVFDNAKNEVLAVLNTMVAGVLRPAADVIERVAARLGLGGGAAVPVGVAAAEADVMRAARAMDARGRTLMDVARDAGRAAAGGAVAPGPGVAVPAGGLP